MSPPPVVLLKHKELPAYGEVSASKPPPPPVPPLPSRAVKNKSSLWAECKVTTTKWEGNFMRMCVAECLELVDQKTGNPPKKCGFSRVTGNGSVLSDNLFAVFAKLILKALDDTCAPNFFPAREDKIIGCNLFIAFDDSDMYRKDRIYWANWNAAQTCDYMFYNYAKYNINDKRLTEPPDASDFHRNLIEVAKQMGAKPILVVGSWDDSVMSAMSFSQATADKASRARFIEAIWDIVKKYNFRGVQISWFFPGCPQYSCRNSNDRGQVVALARELFRPMREAGLKIFFVPPCLNSDIIPKPGDYYSDIFQHIDYFIAEVDNAAGAWWDTATYDNNFKISEEQIIRTGKTMGNSAFLSKVLYQVAVRAKAYQLLDSKDSFIGAKIQPDYKNRYKHIVPVNEYCKQVRNSSFNVVRNPREQNHAIFSDYILIFDDAESLKMKADFMRERGAGMMVVSLGDEDVYGECGCGRMPYLRTVAEHLKGRECKLTPCF